jgi:hypothetical protein
MRPSRQTGVEPLSCRCRRELRSPSQMSYPRARHHCAGIFFRDLLNPTLAFNEDAQLALISRAKSPRALLLTKTKREEAVAAFGAGRAVINETLRAECSAMFLVMCGPFQFFPGIQGQL